MNLTADELRQLASPRARLVENRGDKWVFGIDGVLRGKQIRRSTFDGQNMMVRARNGRDAQALADKGLRDTIAMLDAPSPVAAGIVLETPDERPLKPGEAEARERNRRMVIDALEGKE